MNSQNVPVRKSRVKENRALATGKLYRLHESLITLNERDLAGCRAYFA